MALKPAFTALALKIQEQADQLSHNDLQRWLNDACTGLGCYLVDVIGDGSSGDAIICVNGDLKRVGYEVMQANGKSTVTLDMDAAEEVLPRTTYEPEADDADHMASMEAAKYYTPGALPICERFISKAERGSADSGSFAGKGKSYPILKPGDVQAAVSAMGRAGEGNYDAGTLKRNIIAIAKKKGFQKSLPKAWQDGGADKGKESAEPSGEGELKLIESGCGFLEAIQLHESAAPASHPVRLINAGRGTTAYYPAEVLKRDGPKVFRAGTPMFINHATDAEEAQRPEGDYNALAAVLTEDAHWEDHPKHGAGLYSRAKVFSDHAQRVAEKAPFTGLSIRADGEREPGQIREGRPVLKRLLHAASVDFVTAAGRGGMVLTEAAHAAEGEEADMDQTELNKLKESNRKLSQRLALSEARDIADQKLGTVALPAAAKARVRERLIATAPLSADGDLDRKAFDTLIETEIKDEAEYLGRLTGRQVVVGMGGAQLTEADRVKQAERVRESQDDSIKELAKFMCGAGDDNKKYRKAFREGRAA